MFVHLIEKQHNDSFDTLSLKLKQTEELYATQLNRLEQVETEQDVLEKQLQHAEQQQKNYRK
ncbi:hypothetical protein C6H68_05210 [Photorhabdus luminescens]|nr:hypothetical protein C6H68_05210 [Photorhabdus luminescens]